MPSKGISNVKESFIACADETATFKDVMAIIEARDCKVFIYRMDLEILEQVERSDGVLSNITNYIIEISCFEQVDRTWRQPVFHVDISYGLIHLLLLLPFGSKSTYSDAIAMIIFFTIAVYFYHAIFLKWSLETSIIAFGLLLPEDFFRGLWVFPRVPVAMWVLCVQGLCFWWDVSGVRFETFRIPN